MLLPRFVASPAAEALKSFSTFAATTTRLLLLLQLAPLGRLTVVGVGGGTLPFSFFTFPYECSVQSTYWEASLNLANCLSSHAVAVSAFTPRPMHSIKPVTFTTRWLTEHYRVEPSSFLIAHGVKFGKTKGPAARAAGPCRSRLVRISSMQPTSDARTLRAATGRHRCRRPAR